LRCALVFCSLVTAPCAHSDTGPVGWWKFDEGSGTTSADASGNSNTASLVGGPTWTAGRVGPGSLTFNGTTQSLAASGAGTLANLYTTGLTGMAWIKPVNGGGGGGGRIVDKDNHDEGWFFGLAPNSTVKFSSDQFSTASPSRASATSAITLNTWQHVAATW